MEYVNFLNVGDIVYPGMEIKRKETIILPMQIFNLNNKFFTKAFEVNTSYQKTPKGVKYFGWFSEKVTPRGLNVIIADYKEETHTVYKIDTTTHVAYSDIAIRIIKVFKTSCLGEIVRFKIQ
jgi:hypothetical protein